MHAPGNIARIIIFALGVAAILIVMFATGLADDKAPPGPQGRATVTSTDNGNSE